LENQKVSIQKKIDIERLGANLNVKVGEHGNLQFDKDIFNGSPQEKELYLAAKNILTDSILLPNTALSTIIDSKVCKFLDNATANFFYKSTLDLCIVNQTTFRPELFIELDSSWHDKPKNSENDRMKNEIFQKAGLKLHRIRKKENKEMIEIFELFIKENYAS
jgi:very-short-patch-repair endonuclease